MEGGIVGSDDAFQYLYLDDLRSLQGSQNNTSSAAPTAQSGTATKGNIVRDTLRVYGTLYLVFFLVFSFVRRKYSKYYNLRSWVPEMKCDLAQSMEYSGWFSWAWQVMYVNDTQLLQNCGMDGLCFIRCLRLGAKLSLSGVLNSFWLIPLFLTRQSHDAQVTVSGKFAKITVANLPSGSPRMAGVVVAAYITLFYALNLLSKELEWYAEFRHKYLSQRKPRNYAIYVSGIPEELRSDFALGDYFRSWSSKGAVVEAHICMDIPSLEARVAKREMLVEKLEHAMAIEKILGVKAQHRELRLWNLFRRGAIAERVDSVDAYWEELNKLNKEISFQVGQISNRNHRMRQFMSKQPASSPGKILSVPTLSPVGEQDQDVSFDPEESLGEGSMDYLFGEKQDPNNETRGGVEAQSASDQEVPFIEKKPGYLHRQNTPPHPFLQLVGMGSFYDDGTNTQPNSESNPHNTSSSTGSNEMVVFQDPEVGGDSGAEADIPSMPSESPLVEKGSDLHRQMPNEARSDSEIILPSMENSKRVKFGINSAGKSMKLFSEKVVLKASTGVSGSVKTVTGGVNHVKKIGFQGAAKAADLGRASAKKAAEMGVSSLQQAPELAVRLKESAAFIAPVLAGNVDGAPRNAGFIVFSSLFTCQAARQMLQHASATYMQVEPAPTTHEVFWRNVGLPDNAKKTGKILSTVATAILCFFWSIPVAFVSTLTEVSSLKKNLPILARWVDEMPWLESFLATLAPLLLLILNNGVLPSALQWFSAWEGLVGSPQLEASSFVKQSAFAIIQTFFVSAISGSITAELANILNHPEDIVVLLGNSLTTQSSYFIQIVLVFTFMVQGTFLLRLQPIGVSILRRFVGPRLTAKERRKSWKFARSLEDPPRFSHSNVFAQMILFYVIFFVYAPIAPVTCVFLYGAFLICECGYRYHLIHNTGDSPDSGGRIFKDFTRIYLGSIFIGQLTLLGTLGLKQAVYALPALAPCLIITTIYTIVVYPKKLQVADSLPTILAVELDRQREAERVGTDFLVGSYLQPALKQKFVYPDEDIEP